MSQRCWHRGSEGFEFSWNSTRPHHNVVATKGAGLPATLLYLGENPEITTIKNMHAKLANALMRHEVDVRLEQGDADLSRVSEAVDRLCIVYRQNHTLKASSVLLTTPILRKLATRCQPT